MKNKYKKYYITFISFLTLIIVGISGWTIYKMANAGIGDLLGKFGIENFYLQGLIIIAFSILFLMFIGVGLWKSIEQVIKR